MPDNILEPQANQEFKLQLRQQFLDKAVPTQHSSHSQRSNGWALRFRLGLITSLIVAVFALAILPRPTTVEAEQPAPQATWWSLHHTLALLGKEPNLHQQVNIAKIPASQRQVPYIASTLISIDNFESYSKCPQAKILENGIENIVIREIFQPDQGLSFSMNLLSTEKDVIRYQYQEGQMRFISGNTDIMLPEESVPISIASQVDTNSILASLVANKETTTDNGATAIIYRGFCGKHKDLKITYIRESESSSKLIADMYLLGTAQPLYQITTSSQLVLL